MSLATFSALKTTLAAWLNRAGDTDLTTYIPDMIVLAEAEMNRRITSRRKYLRSTASISSEFVDLPTDFESAVAFTLTSGDPDVRLEFIDAEKAVALRASTYTSAGQPRFYTIVGDEFQFIPTPDATYTAELTYRQNIPALSNSNTSNWVLASHPDLYLYGSLVHAAPFLKDDGRVAVWGTLHERALQSLEKQDAIGNFAGRLNTRAKTFG